MKNSMVLDASFDNIKSVNNFRKTCELFMTSRSVFACVCVFFLNF